MICAIVRPRGKYQCSSPGVWRLLHRRAIQQSFETNFFLRLPVVAQMIIHTHKCEEGRKHEQTDTQKDRKHTHNHTHQAKSHHQAWPALLPKPFPLICRRASCLLVMRTGREAGPSSPPAPPGQAARTNLNCVSNDANSLAKKKTRRMRTSEKKITQRSPLRQHSLLFKVQHQHMNKQHLFFSLQVGEILFSSGAK